MSWRPFVSVSCFLGGGGEGLGLWVVRKGVYCSESLDVSFVGLLVQFPAVSWPQQKCVYHWCHSTTTVYNPPSDNDTDADRNKCIASVHRHMHAHAHTRTHTHTHTCMLNSGRKEAVIQPFRTSLFCLRDSNRDATLQACCKAFNPFLLVYHVIQS